MNRSIVPLRPLRAVLTAAALLHIAAGAAGSWSHVAAAGAPTLQAAAPDSPPEEQDAPPHAEERCVLCHSAASSALAAAPADLPPTVDCPETVRPRAESLAGRDASNPVRARGPPLA